MELASRVDAWRDAAGEDAHGLANRIRDDRIDILVDLAGHAPGGRTDVLALRPARVQLTWLDYFDTMGLSCYDGIVSDGVSTPPGSEVFYAERVLRLPHCRFVFAPAADRPAPGPLPASARGTLAFGSFNRLAKVNRSVIAAWAAILHALPGSRLVLKSTSFDAPDEHAEHRARLAALGLPVDRVTLLPSSNSAGLWRDYQAIDVALDTFPFNGGITTFDALSMGVPVLAVRGDSMVSRQSASLLSAVGLEDWIADDVDGYVRLALRWAERVAELAALRASLPARVRASPLCDAPAFTRALEECYDAALSGLPARTGRA
jgi:predicted O-linked N-acetylglucosamine transferase (SPINDLY family)